MKKMLVLLLLIPCVLYGATDKRLDSAVYRSISTTANYGVRSGNPTIVVTSSGDIIVRVPLTSTIKNGIRTSTDRSTWNYKTDSASGGSEAPLGFLFSEGDSAYFITGYSDNASSPTGIRLFTNGALSFYAQVSAGSGVNNKIGGMVAPDGGSVWVAHSKYDVGATDTGVFLTSSGALDPSESWTQSAIVSVSPYYLGGTIDMFRIDSFLLVYEPANDILHSWNPTSGYHQVTTNLLANPIPTDTGSSACIACAVVNHRCFWIRGDTFGMLYQIRRSRTILLERFRLTSATTVSSLGTTVVTAGTDSTTIPEAGIWFLRSQPSWISYGPHTGDTGAVVYRDWPDTTAHSKARVRWCITTNGGASFSAAATLKDSVTDGGGSPRAYHQLVAPDWVPRDWPSASQFLPVFGYVDSVTGTNIDSFWIRIPDPYTFTGGGSTTSNVTIRSGILRGSTILRNRPEVIWREE